MPHSPPRTLALAGWIVAAMALAWAGFEAVSLWRVLESQPAPPRWDMAGHGWQGVELLTDLRAARPLELLLDLNAQDKWPFGYSLLLLPFLALGGAGFESARLLSLVGWVAVAPLIVLAARKLEPGLAGLLGGSLAAVLWLAAPTPRVPSLVILREMVALALQLLALILYLRAREKDDQEAGLGRWRAAGLATLALGLVKYNYALIWGVAVLIEEVRRSTPEERRRLWRWLREAWTPWGDKPLGRKILAGALDVVLVAAVIGVKPGVGIWLILVVSATVPPGLFGAARRARGRARDAASPQGGSVRCDGAAIGHPPGLAGGGAILVGGGRPDPSLGETRGRSRHRSPGSRPGGRCRTAGSPGQLGGRAASPAGRAPGRNAATICGTTHGKRWWRRRWRRPIRALPSCGCRRSG